MYYPLLTLCQAEMYGGDALVRGEGGGGGLVFFFKQNYTQLFFQRGSTSQHQSFKVTFPIKQVYSCSFIKQTKWPYVIYLIYTTACHFCLYMVRVWISPLLSVSRTAEFHRAHTQTRARTPTHIDTRAHTQVSTLSVSAAADAELEVAEQLPTCYGHYQCLKCTGSYKADQK